MKVAIIGGGCASLTAAFELTRPEHRGRYEVTVYQAGWRLGGKGASGRGAADRIEEHGLHLWMGFYENAFRLMRECYAERQAIHPGSRFVDWRDAFKPAPDVAVANRVDGAWEFWLAHFPPSHGEPGDPVHNPPFTVVDYLQRTALLLVELLRTVVDDETGRGTPGAGPEQASGAARPYDLPSLMSSVEKLFVYGQLATSAAILEACDVLQAMINQALPGVFGAPAAMPMSILDALSGTARSRLESLVASDSHVRCVWQVIDLVLAVLRGSIRSGLAFDARGFDAINDYDWREWLRLHGASEAALESGFMRGIYDLTFAYEDGDVDRPRLAAGVALRGAARMFFTYRGALFWRMSGGMGDVVFAPLYQVLKRRGVRFEFFHRLRRLKLAGEGDELPHVRALEFDVQATIKGGGEYAPLIDVNGLPSWPARPDYAQLNDGDKLAERNCAFEAPWEKVRSRGKRLRVTKDFDAVVLGVGIAALPEIASELIERDARWRAMITNVKTVATQSMQLWLRRNAVELGWPHGAINLSGFVEPFDTWADMSHLIAQESFVDEVRSIAYFCSVLPDALQQGEGVDGAYQERQARQVRESAIRFLKRDVGALWPRALDENGKFRWSLLASPDPAPDAAKRTGSRRFDTQYWTANVIPSDRYVLSLPGSHRYRISPLDMSCDNLTIAGDWTASGLDSGCIESAVISGMLAAHAIARKPELSAIVGYNHP